MALPILFSQPTVCTTNELNENVHMVVFSIVSTITRREQGSDVFKYP